MTETAPRRRWPIVLLVLVALVVATHSSVWWFVTGQMQAALPGFVAQAAREGWAVQFGPPSRAGWPLTASVRVPDLVAARQLGGTRLIWTVNHVDLSITPQDPGTLLVSPAGASAVRLGDAPPLNLHASMAALRAPLDGHRPMAVALRDLVVGEPATGTSVGRVDARIDTGVLAGTAGPIMLSPPLAAPFDQGATLQARIVATPPIPLADTPGESARRWQQAAGRVSMPELRLDWGPLHVEGTVSGGLDGDLQPTGDAQLRVRGAPEVLEAAARAGTVAPGPASAARAVLSLLSLAAQGGPVALPVTLQDRTLTVARFALLRVPVLAWDPP